MNWLIDHWWLHKNRDAMENLDAEMDFLRAQGERLDKRMEEEYGPDWRAECERRLAKALSCRITLE